MKTKKRTFFRNVLALMLRNDRWWSDPRNADKILAHIQYLNRIAFVCVLMFIVSCAGTKKVEKQQAKADIKIETQVQKTTDQTQTGTVTDKTISSGSSNSQKSQELIEKETGEWESRLITYDTSKPLDSLTHKPPVASELVQTNKKVKDKKSTGTDNLMISASEVKDVVKAYTALLQQKNDSLSRVNATLQSKATTTTTTKSNWWIWMIIGIFIPIGIQLAWRFTPLGKLSFIFNKIFSKFTK